ILSGAAPRAPARAPLRRGEMGAAAGGDPALADGARAGGSKRIVRLTRPGLDPDVPRELLPPRHPPVSLAAGRGRGLQDTPRPDAGRLRDRGTAVERVRAHLYPGHD